MPTELFSNRILVDAPEEEDIIKQYGWISFVAVTVIMSIAYISVRIYYRKCSIDRISKFIPVFITISYLVDCIVELYEHRFKAYETETYIDNVIVVVDSIIRFWALQSFIYELKR